MRLLTHSGPGKVDIQPKTNIDTGVALAKRTWVAKLGGSTGLGISKYPAAAGFGS